MKKVLLSFLLVLLCSLKSFASHPNRWVDIKCYSWVDGELRITVHVGSDYTSGLSFIPIWVLIGGTPPPVMVLSDDITYPPVSIPGGFKLTYVLPGVTTEPTGCIEMTYGEWYGDPNNLPHEAPYGATYERICPCPPCDASFIYCVKEGSTPGTWDFTYTMLETTPPGLILIRYIDGAPDYSNPYTSNTVTFTEGTYKFCLGLLDPSNEHEIPVCSYCVDICFGDGKKEPKPLTQKGMANIKAPVVKIYPNPTSDLSKMEFNLLADEQVTIELIDISGRVISTIKDEVAAKGYHAVDINTAGVPSGTYIVRMKTGNTVSNYRLTVIK